MDYKVLYRKYRPQNFDGLVGQDHIKSLLVNSIINNKLSHAYIFTGPRGTGKTSTAKLFAKAVNCENSALGIPCEKCVSCCSYNETPDIIEIDAASNNGVDEIRELRDNVKIMPALSKYKVYIIDEVHMLSTSAWNAFLKTLEEPPKHVIFILATTELQKVPITVLSRCQRFDFQRIDMPVIAKLLTDVASSENINISPEAITEISYLVDGGMRDALGILDQLSKLDCRIEVETLKKSYGIIINSDIESLMDNVQEGNVHEFIKILDGFHQRGVDSTVLLNKMLEYCIQVMIKYKTTGNYETILGSLADIITGLSECYHKNKPYISIKSVFIKYCPMLKSATEEKQLISSAKITEENHKIISREIISKDEAPKEVHDISTKIIEIRINNAYVDANIKLKKEFVVLWNNLLSLIKQNKDIKYLSLLQEVNVEVVSPTNVILSTKFYSNSVLFNELIDDIEAMLLAEFQINKKLICLDEDRWKKEKEEYIKNKEKKKYILISEPEKVSETNSTIDSAENLFGNELVEIN